MAPTDRSNQHSNRDFSRDFPRRNLFTRLIGGGSRKAVSNEEILPAKKIRLENKQEIEMNGHSHHSSSRVLDSGRFSSNSNSTAAAKSISSSIASSSQTSVASLCNLGNTCFLNSVLYTLRFTPGFLHNLHHLTADLGIGLVSH